MPSPWIVQWAGLVAADATVLDVAAGGGRHTRFFADRGNKVTAIDRDISALAAQPNVEIVQADLEDGSPWPLPGRTFGAVIVTNYLHRPLFPALLDALMPGGVLLYETFMEGNERFGRPSNPEFLLKDGELLELARDRLSVVGLRGAHDQRAEDGDGPAHRRTQSSDYSAAFATAGLCSTGSAYFRSCVSDGTILRASAILAGSTSAMTKPAFSPPASASTSPHGATAIEWP